jgi:RNA recognition motif-containing protein
VKELSKKIYVGNLSYNTTETQVKELFEEYGSVQSIAWITDRDTGRFRGFAFVEMEESSANAAIKSLNDQLVDGRELRVNEAKPKKDDNRGKSSRNKGYNDRW